MSRRSGLRDTNLKLVAGAAEILSLQGNYFRLSSSVSDVIVEIEGTDVFKLSPGEDVVYPVDEEFSRVVLRTLAAVEDSVTVTVGKNVKVGSAKVSGSIAVNNFPVGGVYSHAREQVTNAFKLLLNANPNRKVLFIQNNDLSVPLRVRFDGGAPSATVGLRLMPGESWKETGICHTGAVTLSMEAATNQSNNVEFLSL